MSDWFCCLCDVFLNWHEASPAFDEAAMVINAALEYYFGEVREYWIDEGLCTSSYLRR